MAFTIAVFTRELVDTRGPRASSMRPNAAGAQGLTLERQRVAADIARQERRSLSREQRGLKRERPLLSQAIDWAADPQRPPIEDVQVDHGGADIPMTEQLLYPANVVPVDQRQLDLPVR